MKRLMLTAAAIAVLATPAAAQDNEMGMGADHTDPVTSITKLQDTFMGWVAAAADQVPESDYGFKPTPEVRSFGQLFGHVANANFMFCAGARGEENPSKADLEKAGKAEIVAGLKAAMAYCTQVAEWAKAHHHEARTFFGQSGDVTWVMAFNIAHNAEHYGNLVTYMRLKGMVPPSSQ
jgi:uncharacterized damage-inducible protein DinB